MWVLLQFISGSIQRNPVNITMKKLCIYINNYLTIPRIEKKCIILA